MSPLRAQATGQRLVSTALALTALVPVVAAAVTLLVDGPAGPVAAASALLVAVVVAFAAVVRAAVCAAPPGPPALALLVACAAALLTHRLLGGAAAGAAGAASPPWAYFLGIAAVASCAVLVRSWPLWRAGLVLVLWAAVVVVLRTPVPAGEAAPAVPLVDGSFLVGLGAAVYAAVRGVEDVSSRVRTARAAAARADAEAEALVSAEAERSRWEAAVHDDVLTALRVAAAARSPEEAVIAATAAQGALDGIARGPATLVVSAALAGQQLRAAAATARPGTEVALSVGPGSLPGSAAEALVDATSELLRNTARHNPLTTSSSVRGHLAGDGVRLVVSDDGAGFDPDRVPEGRLGVRVSVVGRMRSAGGEAEVSSAPGRGTTVRLRWPR